MKEFEKLIKFLREQASAIASKDGKAAEAWNAMASEIEAAKVAGESATAIEDTIAARIKNGDLIPKAKHEEAVAAAEKSGHDKAVKAAEEKAAAEKRNAEVVASRNKAVSDAGLDPKFVLVKDRTIEQVVASIPTTDEGNKLFEERLEEWKNLSKKTGQAQATASAAATKNAPPMGGGQATDNSKKPGYAFV